MRGFLWGLLLGVLVSSPLAYNFGRGVPLLSNPLAETRGPDPTATYDNAARRTGEALLESASRATERVQAVAEEAAAELRRTAAEATEQVREAARQAIEDARRETGANDEPTAGASPAREPGSVSTGEQAGSDSTGSSQ